MRNLRLGTNTTYIPLIGIGVSRLGETQILGLAPGVKHIFAFLDINMLEYLMQNIDQRNVCYAGTVLLNIDST